MRRPRKARESSGEYARSSAMRRSSPTSPFAVTRFTMSCSNAFSSSTPRRISRPVRPNRSMVRCTVSSPMKSRRRFVARLLLMAIMCSASSLTRIVLPIDACTSESASRSARMRNGEPSYALRNRLRTCRRDWGANRPRSISPYTARRMAILIVLAPWNQRSASYCSSAPDSASWSATAIARASDFRAAASMRWRSASRFCGSDGARSRSNADGKVMACQCCRKGGAGEVNSKDRCWCATTSPRYSTCTVRYLAPLRKFALTRPQLLLEDSSCAASPLR